MWQATGKAIELIKLVSHYNKISAHCIVQDNIHCDTHKTDTQYTQNRTKEPNRNHHYRHQHMPKVIKLNELRNTENGN